MSEIIVGSAIRATYIVRGTRGALLCPPHPLMGGNRFDVRLERIAAELHKINYSTLTFDYRTPFRGGVGEIEDARSCLLYLKERHDFVAVIGYSFGSVVASNIADEADALVLISPLKRVNEIELRDSNVPKLIIIARYDEIVSFKESEEIAKMLSEPKKVVVLDTDHFYTGMYLELAKEIAEFLAGIQ